MRLTLTHQLIQTPHHRVERSFNRQGRMLQQTVMPVHTTY
ncbi:hypothetical protein BLL52_1915 [Rhodoferax antarcticus ANT.BR]|uniref:Uncharacterized protein n=1 Tax=Rhodoferax antarcticus ANT.BR TaxID=1111071 RepID=A0A1Q8YFI1_9BURK|nr:hypothetical protein BLL52_1915 [Rhodoferax antarcticus ANT.BR]